MGQALHVLKALVFLAAWVGVLVYFVVTVSYPGRNKFHLLVPVAYVVCYLLCRDAFCVMDDGTRDDIFYLQFTGIMCTFLLKFIKYRPLYVVTVVIAAIPAILLSLFFVVGLVNFAGRLAS